jgi:hypothetical protein
MTIPVIFILVGLIGLSLLISLIVGRSRKADLDALTAQLQPIDVNAFRNLIDEQEEEYLRMRLPAHEFRSIHRERMLAAADYVWATARNSGILVRLAQAAKDHPDPAVAAAAESLFENALQARLYALRIIPRVYLSMLFPDIRHTPDVVAERYETATRQVVMLRVARSHAVVNAG